MNDLVYRQLVQRLIDQCLVSCLMFLFSFDGLISCFLPVRRRFVGCPELLWSLEHSPPLTLQHIRANRSRLLKRRKA